MSTSSEDSLGVNVNLTQAEKKVLKWALLGNLTYLINDMVLNNPEDLANFHPIMDQVTQEINNMHLVNYVFEEDYITDLYFEMKLQYNLARSRMWHNHLSLVDMTQDEADLIIAFTNMKFIP